MVYVTLKRLQLCRKWLKPFLVFGLVWVCFPLSLRAELMPSDEAIFQEIQSLQKLKQENPSAYRAAIEGKRNSLKKEMQNFEPSARNEFNQFVESRRESKRKRLNSIREKNPEIFQQFRERRFERFKRFEQAEPGKFQQFLKDRPRLAENFRDHRNQEQRPSDYQDRKPRNSAEKPNQKQIENRYEAERNSGSGRFNPQRSEPFRKNPEFMKSMPGIEQPNIPGNAAMPGRTFMQESVENKGESHERGIAPSGEGRRWKEPFQEHQRREQESSGLRERSRRRQIE